MPRYRFVHAADLHLDSPFHGLFGDAPQHAEVLRRASFDVYERIADLCIEHRVDALLVAGDVFDSADNSLRAQLKFRDGLVRLAQHGIQSFICHGNHDPLDGWRAGLDWPPEAHRFGPDPQSIPLYKDDPHSPVVHGISYPTREVRTNLVPRFPLPESGRPAIGLLHANVGSNTGHESYAPCSVDDLIRTGYDYWALGHVHTRNVLRSPGQGAPVIVYPGNPQGRHSNERGARGVYLVEMDEHGAVTDLQFRAVEVVRWETLELSIDAFEDAQDLIDALESEVRAGLDAAEGRHLVYGVHFSGRGVLNGSLARPGFLVDLRDRLNEQFAAQRPFALCERIFDGTAIPVDRGGLARGGDFIADLLAQIDEIRASPSEMSRLAEDARLDDLYRHARARRYLSGASPEGPVLTALVDEAERLLLGGLIEGADQ